LQGKACHTRIKPFDSELTDRINCCANRRCTDTHIMFNARSTKTAGLVESGRSYALVLSDAMLRTLKDASNGVLVMDTSECMAEVS
jgi:hypothetical protein